MKIDESLIDVRSLDPGSVLSQETCERVLGVRLADDPLRYQLGLVKLYGTVYRLLWRAGKKYTLTCDHRQINVLHPTQASRYNDRRFQAALRVLRRTHRRLQVIDISTLEPQAREAHDRALLRQSQVLLSVRAVTARTTGVPAPVSDRPGLMPGLQPRVRAEGADG